MQKAWDDYYPTTIDPPTESNTYSDLTFNSNNETLQPTTGNSYVFNCYFYELSATDGGAILYSVSNSYFLASLCNNYPRYNGIMRPPFYVPVSPYNTKIHFSDQISPRPYLK